MRTLLVLGGVLACSAMLVPVSAPQALPIDDLRLVAEQRTSDVDLIAAGKNGNTGKNGKGAGGGLHGSGGGPSARSPSIGSFFGTLRATDTGGSDLVAVDLR
jgi:hypothetical protein